MRRLMNVLYVTTQDSYLALDGENAVLRVEQETRFRMPLHNLESIVCFGHVNVSPPLMGHCMECGVPIAFMSMHGAFLARVSGRVSGNVLLRRRQYRLADSEEAAGRLAARFVTAKLFNSRAVLERAGRDHANVIPKEPLSAAAQTLAQQMDALRAPHNADSVRGIEGDASRAYFQVFDHLILQNKPAFFFHERTRRPPLDAMNSLMSFLYTLLAHDVQSALETVGLDPAVGFLHCDRPGRPSLALDLMEELRAFLADRLALTLINRRQVEPGGFVAKESGGILMDDATRKTVITAWQARKQEEIRHPFLDENIEVGLIPYAQALLLARHIRGDLEDYPCFLWR